MLKRPPLDHEEGIESSNSWVEEALSTVLTDVERLRRDFEEHKHPRNGARRTVPLKEKKT